LNSYEVKSLVGNGEAARRILATISRASVLNQRSEGESTEDRRGSWNKKQFLGKLEIAAKENRTWIDIRCFLGDALSETTR
jgi:hypothetical protein